MEKVAAPASSSTRTFSFKQCDWLGFDLDHTLIRYSHDNINSMIFNCMMTYLVDELDYPESLKELKLNNHFIKRGNVVDKVRGNILKLTPDCKVVVAYHGTRKLTRGEIIKIYEDKPLPFTGLSNKDFWSMTTFFEVTVAWMFGVLVDLEDEKGPSHPGEVNIYYRDYSGHITALFNAMTYNFGEYSKGWFFREMEKNLDKYIFKHNKVREWLLELRKSGKKLFLLTNSLPEYLNLLMNYAYGTDWPSLFDFVSSNAKKPFYFTESNLYYETVWNESRSEVTVSNDHSTAIDLSRSYTLGNVKLLIDAIRRQNGSSIEKSEDNDRPISFCYFGDHLQYDVAIPKKHLNWYTVAIVEELEQLEQELGVTFEEHESYYDGTDHVLTAHDSSNDYWGSYFYADDAGDDEKESLLSAPEKKRLSYWADHILTTADIYVPCVSRLAGWHPDHTFEDNNCSVRI